MRRIFAPFCCALWLSISAQIVLATPEIRSLQYVISDQFDHDPKIFTQGLLWYQGLFYESGGGYGRSQLLIHQPSDTTPLRQRSLVKSLFAEGIALFQSKIYQLTWKAQQGFIYSADTLEPVGRFTYRGEGWGLTSNGVNLIMSNGSSRLSVREPQNFSEVGYINVSYQGKPVHKLNELEWVDGLIAANVWQTDRIVFIAPDSGKVVATLDLDGLLSESIKNRNIGVLNGIAYNAEERRLYVTGKHWPLIFALQLQPSITTVQ